MYLGVTLDRTLSYKQHLTKTAAKITTRNNLLQKLTGTSWGASAHTLRSSAMALCWSVAEYCAPVWSRSSHTGLIDTRLNDSMRIITGSLRPTPLAWLPVLANIPPPTIRREALAASFAASIVDREELPLHVDLAHHPPLRLTSRNPIWQSPHDVDINLKWREMTLTQIVSWSMLVLRREPVQGQIVFSH